MGKLIGHLDADCFYCSAERVRHKHLIGHPIGVLGNQGACVIAKSYEAKAGGVSTGMPIWDARKLLPEMVFIKRDFRWYEVLSRKMLEIVRQESPLVEYYSIDEFFFEADKFTLDKAKSLQHRLLKETGVPVTLGISLSRSLAKLISDNAKPFGCKFLTEGLPDFLDRLPVDAITGIASRSAAKLNKAGIFSCWDFTHAPRSYIRSMLTVKGEKLWMELNGTPCDPIQQKRKPHKAISRGGSMGGKTTDPFKLEGWIARNTERLIEELDFHYVNTERITLILAGDEGHWALRTNVFPTHSFQTICDVLKKLLRAFPRFVVSHMHVIAEKLTNRDQVQQSLFEGQKDPVAGLKAQVNGQIGRFVLRSGDTLRIPEIYKDTTNDYDICDIREKSCF